MLSTYQNYLMLTRNPVQTLQRTASDPVVKRAQQYYTANIGKVKSVDDFLNNFQLFTYATTAYGLQDMAYAKAFMKKVLTSDLTDAKSFVNKLNDTRFKAFAQAFQFDTKGKIPDASKAQSSDQTTDMLTLFKSASTLDTISTTIESAYMQTAVSSLKTVTDLTGNKRLLADVLTAYGIDPATSTDTITKALESDPSDPTSLVNQSGKEALKKLASDFNFSATGAITTQRLVQTQNNFTSMAKAYIAAVGTDTASKTAATTEATAVGTLISKATSIDDILGDARVVKFIGTAFGDPKITAKTLKSVLTSDLTDMKSTANSLGTKYAKIAAAFEFTTKGTVAREPAVAAQSRASIAATNSAYLENTIETQAGADNPGTQLALYFVQKAPTLTNAYQILGDKALLKFAQTVLNLPASTSAGNIDAQARQITSGIKFADLADPKKLNALVSKFTVLYDIANPAASQDNVSLLFAPLSSSSSTGSLTF